MKSKVALGLMLVSTGAMAQEFVAPIAPHEDVPVVRPSEVRPKPTVEGIVKEVFETKKPWQLVNPLAPKEYGNGEKTVAYSEKDPGKPKGFIFFALEW